MRLLCEETTALVKINTNKHLNKAKKPKNQTNNYVSNWGLGLKT
jgi:hypothetical protein